MNQFLKYILYCSIILFVSCKKPNIISPVILPVIAGADTIPADPSTAASIGFFMDNWAPKSFIIPAATIAQPLTTNAATVTVTINTGQVITKIAPTYFGNNSNPYIGQIGTDALLTGHLANIAPGFIRGPGGSLSDLYFFNRPNNSPLEDMPDTLLNADGSKYRNYYWYGKNTDSWTQSIDNYYQLLSATNSKGMLTVNYGYARYGTGPSPVQAAAHLAADWVRYDNGRTKYWEIGNENGGSWEAGYRIDVTKNHDGQPEFISGDLYGKHFKIFADSMHKAAAETGNTIQIGAQLEQSANSTSNWNSGLFAQAGNTPDFYIVHDYFTPYNQNSNVATIINTAADETRAVMNWMNITTTDAGVSMKPIALTEWNLFASGSKQNVSHIAGLHAVLTLGELIKNKFGAALRWDLANGWANGDDHGLFSWTDEPGAAKWNPRPAFYYLYYFQKNTGDRMLFSAVTGSTDIASFASSFSSGQKAVVLVNKGTTEKTVTVKFQYFTPGSSFYYYVLTGGTDNGEFSRMVIVNGNGASNGVAGGPADSYKTIKMYSSSVVGDIKIDVPARSVVFMVVDKK